MATADSHGLSGTRSNSCMAAAQIVATPTTRMTKMNGRLVREDTFNRSILGQDRRGVLQMKVERAEVDLAAQVHDRSLVESIDDCCDGDGKKQKHGGKEKRRRAAEKMIENRMNRQIHQVNRIRP